MPAMLRLRMTIVLLLLGAAFASASSLPGVTHYDWQVTVDYEREAITSSCRMSLVHRSQDTLLRVPLLLYRLLTVDSVYTPEGAAIHFSQQVRSFSDFDRLQANVIELELPRPLTAGDPIDVIIDYHGYLAGYRETGMLYVQDRVDPAFTILRPDCFAYPEIGVPSFAANRADGLPEFSYRLRVSVPDSFVVANVGKRVSEERKDGRLIAEYRSTQPAWRMDVCIADYRHLASGGTIVYSFASDSAGAVGAAGAMSRCIDLYTRWFGPLRDSGGFTMIEIPEGFGSQADHTGILQTASAFRDSASWSELYHELSHQWNVREAGSPPCRWQEGLASFLELLAADSLDGQNRLRRQLEATRDRVRKHTASNPKLLQVAPADYGTQGMTDHSYSVGMLSCWLLWEIAGHEAFSRMLREAYQTAGERAMDLHDVEALAVRIAGPHLTNFFSDWFFSPTGVQLLASDQSLAGILTRYRR